MEETGVPWENDRPATSYLINKINKKHMSIKIEFYFCAYFSVLC